MEDLIKILRSKILLGFLGILVVVLLIVSLFSNRKDISNKEEQFGTQPTKKILQSELDEITKIFIAQRDIALNLGYPDEAEKYNQIAFISINQNSPRELVVNINDWQLVEETKTTGKKERQALSQILVGLTKKQLNTIAQDYINIANIDFERGELNEMEKYLILLSKLPNTDLYLDIKTQIKRLKQAIKEEKNGNKNRESYKSMPQPTIDISQLDLDRYSLSCITKARYSLENNSFNEAEKWLEIAYKSLNLKSAPDIRAEITGLTGRLGAMRLREAEKQKERVKNQFGVQPSSTMSQDTMNANIRKLLESAQFKLNNSTMKILTPEQKNKILDDAAEDLRKARKFLNQNNEALLIEIDKLASSIGLERPN